MMGGESSPPIFSVKRILDFREKIMTESKALPKWIIYYGWFNAIATLGFGIMFYMNSNPTVSGDLSWFAGGRNIAIFVVWLFALLRKEPKLLFAGFLLRFIVDLGDMSNSFLAGDIFAGLTFLPLFTIPQAIAVWTLWKLTKDD